MYKDICVWLKLRSPERQHAKKSKCAWSFCIGSLDLCRASCGI